MLFCTVRARWSVTVSVLFFVLLIGAGLAYAALPYAPGQTLDPTCHPGEPNCTVQVFAASGDLSGSSTRQTVIGLQGNPVASTTPTSSQVLQWNGSAWAPATLSASTSTNYWSATSSGIYYNASGSVSVGTTVSSGTPANSLVVAGVVLGVNIPVSIKDFGAVGDGSHDDTTAVQAAINATNAHGGTIYMPKGVYKITSTLNIADSDLRLFGDGPYGTQLIFYPPTSGAKLLNIYCASNCGATGLNYSSDIKLENFGVFLGVNTTPAVAVFIRNASHVILDHIKIDSWTDVSGASIGLQTQGREYLILDGVQINATLPWSIEMNPDYPGAGVNEDCNFCHVRDSAFAALGSTQPVIKVHNRVHGPLAGDVRHVLARLRVHACQQLLYGYTETCGLGTRYLRYRMGRVFQPHQRRQQDLWPHT